MTIDIMLPYYGDVALLNAAVESVLRQDDPDLRLTVVDDGYPDPSVPGQFARLTEQDPRVVYLRNESNLGANANFRRCASLVEHPITVFMGADDVMLPGYVRTVREAFAAPGVDLVQPGVQVIDERGSVYEPAGDKVKGWLRRRAVGEATAATLTGEAAAVSLLTGNWLYFPSVAWSSDRVRRHPFRAEYDVVQDLALALDIIADGGTLLVTDAPCFQYRRHRRSDSSVRAADGRRFTEELAFFQDRAAAFRRRGWRRAERAARLHLTSRMHAATLLPGAIARRTWPAAMTLLGHTLRP
ncbi:glycosyltransferase family 2 protein [Georgenia thermotolerans]|uniref:Glycosyltransferase n=1 Tax=Georgenia thermotolerans TaxID=527326 RepID=A0A7J5UQ73_9MICO|nr:glycosyltransferase family 2 protein [Georgenia thermotolerans]KAE8764562.1 glycosyltransferase [Georgenia thermotolerans]